MWKEIPDRIALILQLILKRLLHLSAERLPIGHLPQPEFMPIVPIREQKMVFLLLMIVPIGIFGPI
jgi:hypothetical protein